MGNESVIDLDVAAAARAEKKGPPPKLRFKGKEFTLPPELPFEAVEAMAELGANGPDAAARNAGGTAQMAKVLFGESYREFMDLRPSVDDVSEMFEKIGPAYGIEKTGESSASES